MTRLFTEGGRDGIMGVARNLLKGQTKESGGRKSPAGYRGRIWKPRRTPTGPRQKLTYG